MAHHGVAHKLLQCEAVSPLEGSSLHALYADMGTLLMIVAGIGGVAIRMICSSGEVDGPTCIERRSCQAGVPCMQHNHDAMGHHRQSL